MSKESIELINVFQSNKFLYVSFLENATLDLTYDIQYFTNTGESCLLVLIFTEFVLILPIDDLW